MAVSRRRVNPVVIYGKLLASFELCSCFQRLNRKSEIRAGFNGLNAFVLDDHLRHLFWGPQRCVDQVLMYQNCTDVVKCGLNPLFGPVVAAFHNQATDSPAAGRGGHSARHVRRMIGKM